MSKWKIALVLLFLLFWLSLTVWIWFGGSPSAMIVWVIGSLLQYVYTGGEPRSFLELTFTFPEPIAVFLYTFERMILVYIAAIVLAAVIAVIYLRRAVAIVWRMPNPTIGDGHGGPFTPQGWEGNLISAALFVRQGFSRWRASGVSLAWKMAGKLAATVVLVGLLIVGIVYYWMVDALRKQVDDQALAVASQLSQWAAARQFPQDTQALNDLLVNYAAPRMVAYIFIEDGQGGILGHTLARYPAELQRSLSLPAARESSRNVITFMGQQVFDTRVPIADNQPGAVHVGIWAAARDREIRRTVLPTMGIMIFIVLLGALLSVWLIVRMSRPIVRLARMAERMSTGDLDTPIPSTSRDEIGDLALSLERMRSSLKASIDLMGRRPPQDKEKKP